MTDGAIWLFFLIPLLFVVAVFAGLAFMFRAAGARPPFAPIDPPEGRARPWWGNPWLWLGVAAVFLVLGLFVFPQLLGFSFIFLPFFWIGSARRRSRAPQTPE